MAARVTLRDVVDAIDLPSQEWQSYLDSETGEIVTVTDDERRLAKDWLESIGSNSGSLAR